ncbi:hypothetical protein [Streptomyces sp. NPDC085596]|uniref:hypothetical protein n=1 Tax=Streptomyces sp. NPDC085596 TaxID=3365731 RepID=UPI0037CEDB95
MTPSFNDPELQAIANWLTKAAVQPAADARPTPANMPRRAQRPLDPADVARAAGLDFGNALRPRKSPGPRPARRRPAKVSVFREVFDFFLARGRTREEAHTLTRSWLEVEHSAEGVRSWVEAIGMRQAGVVKDLVAHGFSIVDLDTVIDGFSVRRLLRDGSASGQVVAALLSRRNPASL